MVIIENNKVKELEKELEKIGLTTDAIDAAIDYNNGEGTGEGTDFCRSVCIRAGKSDTAAGKQGAAAANAA